ncbi:cysteine--tRNA ligase, partial [Patescibacteria group bacterium]
MMLRFYNTAARKIEEFAPRKKTVGLYTCGPTVYHYAHIGNLRSFILSDILRRTLLYSGYRVKQVMNITDVGHLVSDADTGEEKIAAAARREGKTAWEVAEFYTQAFLADLKALNIKKPSALPRATEWIKEQIALVRLLEKKGFTYQTSDGIYFDSSKLSSYGALSGQRLEEREAGKRVALGEKKRPTDFALWKFSSSQGLTSHGGQTLKKRNLTPKRDMEWKSPWGTGFPGWHTECSAMSRAFLGQPFDLHTGGIDLIFPHHTNEIAQSEAAYGRPLARFWLHGEFVVLGQEEKMAKSAGNIVTLGDIQKRGLEPLAFR